MLGNRQIRQKWPRRIVCYGKGVFAMSKKAMRVISVILAGVMVFGFAATMISALVAG